MSTDLPIISTPLLSRCAELARDAVNLDCIGVLIGPNGTGKTIALKNIVSRYPSLGLPGVPLYHRACAAQGYTRGVKDILVDFGVREGHGGAANLQIACKVGLREFSSRNVKLLILDESDVLAKDSLSGIITLVDFCTQNGHRIGLILGAVREAKSWFSENGSGISRTLRCERSQNLPIEESLAILHGWLPSLSPLLDRAKTQEPNALRLVRSIYRGTGDGNLRRMSFFAKLLNFNSEITESAIKEALAKIEFSYK